MSARRATRPLIGEVPHSIEVRYGYRTDASPGATIDSHAYRGGMIPLRDPAVVRKLIADLQEVLPHLERTTCERRDDNGVRCELLAAHPGKCDSPGAYYVPLSRRK